jgi:hypothetical protein
MHILTYFLFPFPNKIVVEQMIEMEFDSFQRKQIKNFNLVMAVPFLIHRHILKKKWRRGSENIPPNLWLLRKELS